VVRVAGAVVAAALILGGCQQGGGAGQAGDKYAGLDTAIRTWHASIKDTHALCASKTAGQACQGFEVACKGERPLGQEEASKGVTAKIIAAMSWEAWDPKAAEYRPASGVAEFTKVGSEWRRSDDAGPVNLSTCA
jgi:hypothetical protein